MPSPRCVSPDLGISESLLLERTILWRVSIVLSSLKQYFCQFSSIGSCDDCDDREWLLARVFVTDHITHIVRSEKGTVTSRLC